MRMIRYTYMCRYVDICNSKKLSMTLAFSLVCKSVFCLLMSTVKRETFRELYLFV